MTHYEQTCAALRAQPLTWAVTGAAGFIGSNLVEELLLLDQRVVGLDNLETGHQSNLDEVRAGISEKRWGRFTFIEGDIRTPHDCQRVCAKAEIVLHQAALGSVPRSVKDPLRSHATNVDGFLNLVIAARDANVKRIVYASSSSVYGSDPQLPKVESSIGRPLSPYAATKLINEIYADVVARCYGTQLIGLRYFNVFGRRQDPNGAYAAVIPKWFAALLAGESITINGNGETSRDFCYISNIVQANILAGTAAGEGGSSRVYNIACGRRVTLLQLHEEIRAALAGQLGNVRSADIRFGSEREGDVRHSLANIDAARSELGYAPTHFLQDGLREAASWYIRARRSEAQGNR